MDSDFWKVKKYENESTTANDEFLMNTVLKDIKVDKGEDWE